MNLSAIFSQVLGLFMLAYKIPLPDDGNDAALTKFGIYFAMVPLVMALVSLLVLLVWDYWWKDEPPSKL